MDETAWTQEVEIIKDFINLMSGEDVFTLVLVIPELQSILKYPQYSYATKTLTSINSSVGAESQKKETA